MSMMQAADAAAKKISKIEELIGRTIRRDISRLANFARGNIERAAVSLLQCSDPHVGLTTGFFIQHAEPPSPETDGLNGAAHLAAGLSNAGIKVTVVTDAPCAKAVWAVLSEVPTKVDLQVVGVDKQQVIELRGRLQGTSKPVTHFIAIERPSPGSDGRPHREHGWDMSADTAPIDLLFHDPGWERPWVTIGIGDGGNEIGMGSLPREIIQSDIPNGGLIGSTTPADYLIVAGVSNWGAYALLAAMSILSPAKKETLLECFSGEMERRFLRAAVELGQAVDDSRTNRPGRLQMSVDRLPIQDHVKLIENIREIVMD